MDRQQTTDDRRQNPAAFKMDDVQEDNIVPRSNLLPRLVLAVVAGIIAIMVVLALHIANLPPKSDEEEVVSDVVYLDDENFAEQTASGRVLVDFYTDWCGPCQMMAPAIESVATRYKGKAVVAKVNAEISRRLTNKFGVRAYPTLVLLQDGREITRIEGAQNEPELVLLLETVLEPSKSDEEEVVSDVAFLDDENFVGQTASGIVLVDFYTDWCPPCQMMSPFIEKIATRYKGKAVVAKVNIETSLRLANQFKVEAIPTLVLLKDGQEITREVGLKTEPELVSLLEMVIEQ